MKRTIIKTAVITFLALIAACATFFLILSVASPKTLGSFCLNLGMKNAAVKQYERQYKNKGEDFDALVELTDVAILADDEEAVARYGKILTIDNKSKLKALSDGKNDATFERTLYDYYATRTVEALYKTTIPGDCVEAALNTTENYTVGSSLKFAVNLSINENDKNLAVCIYTRYLNGKYKDKIVEGKKEFEADVKKLVDAFEFDKINN